MSLSRKSISVRARRFAAAGSVAALTGAILAAPAAAAPVCVLEVSTAAEYVTALECASDADQAVTISLLTDIEVPGTALPLFTGSHHLTIDGNGNTVTSTPGDELEQAQGLFLAVSGSEETFHASDVTVTDVTVQGFEAELAVVLMVSTGTLTINNSTFSDNGPHPSSEDSSAGSATVMAAHSVAVNSSTFTNNSNQYAGAITIEHFFLDALDSESRDALADAGVTVTDSTFVGNETDEYGGAIYSDGPVTVTGSTFSENEAGERGGAIYSDGPVTVTGSTFLGNTANDGAAILSRDGLHIATSAVVDNHATLATIYNSGELTVESSTFSGNVSGYDSTIYTEADTGAVRIENSTFANNINPYGAIQLTNDGDVATIVRHATFAHNAGEFAHLNFYNNSSEASDFTIDGTVFIGDAEDGLCDFNGTVPASSHNFDVDGSCTNDWAGEGDFGDGVDPLLGTLADNFGPTQTLLPLEGSPLIDAVPAGTTDLTVDQRGLTRPYGDAADIGAVEVQPIVEDEDEDGDTGGPSDPGEPGDDAGLVNFQVKTDGGVLYGTATAAVAVTDINWTATSQLTGAPANTALPYGAAGFTVEVPERGASVTVTLTAPAPFTSAYKVSGDTWTAIPGATFSADGTTVTYTLTDGGDLDEDGQANGYIVDPVALAVQATFTG